MTTTDIDQFKPTTPLWHYDTGTADDDGAAVALCGARIPAARAIYDDTRPAPADDDAADRPTPAGRRCRACEAERRRPRDITATNDDGAYILRLDRPGKANRDSWGMWSGDRVTRSSAMSVIVPLELMRALADGSTATVAVHGRDLDAWIADHRRQRARADMNSADARVLAAAWEAIEHADPADPTVAALRAAAGTNTDPDPRKDD